ncbi:MAG: hypothetical protein BIFFINMI_03855 [Phycisphaerae bacterium]|nr:hypothetical protein [Phycisphaerae bacterium]
MKTRLGMMLLAAGPLLAGCYIGEAFQDPPPASPPRLERVAAADALAGDRRFSAGPSISARQAEDGTLEVMMSAAGVGRPVTVQREAEFYSLSSRPDLIVMHDRYKSTEDVIRVFHFSPAGVRERIFGHGALGRGYAVKVYTQIDLHRGHVSALEELAMPVAGGSPLHRRYAIPLD